MNIKPLRQSLGLTQQALADRVGINRAQVQKLEAGTIDPGNMTARNLLKLADVLGVDPHKLIE